MGDKSAYRKEIEKLAEWCTNHLHLTKSNLNLIVAFRKGKPEFYNPVIIVGAQERVSIFKFWESLSWKAHQHLYLEFAEVWHDFDGVKYADWLHDGLKRNVIPSDPDQSRDGKGSNERGSLGAPWEKGNGFIPSDSLGVETGGQSEKGEWEPGRRERPHSAPRPDSKDPTEFHAPSSGRLKLRPVEGIESPNLGIPDTLEQTSSPGSDGERNLPAWAEEILNTYLGQVGERVRNLPGSIHFAARHLEGGCQPPGQTTPARVSRTKLDIVITLAPAGHAGAEIGDPERSAEVQMAESPSKPVERVEECGRYAANAGDTPVAGSSGLDELSPHLGNPIPPRPSGREPGFSRFLPMALGAQVNRKPDLQKKVSLPGGLAVDCNKGEGETKIMSTNSEIGPETDQHLSICIPSQTADDCQFTPIANSTSQQNVNGSLGVEESSETNSSLQPNKEDLKHVYKEFIKDESVVKGSGPVSKVVSFSDHPTLSDGAGNQSAINSLICIGTIENDPSQLAVKDPPCSESFTLQYVNPSEDIQQLKSLHQKGLDQNGDEMVISLKNGESTSGKMKLDSEQQSLLFNSQPEQNSVNFPIDLMRGQATETSALSSQSILLQEPVENSKDFKIESPSVVNLESQAYAFRFAERNGDQVFHPSGSSLSENQQLLGVFTENKMKERVSNSMDEPDGELEIDGFVDAIRNLDVPMLLSRNRNSRSQRSHSYPSPLSMLPPIEEDQMNPKHLPTLIPEEPPDLETTDGKLVSSSHSQSVVEIPRISFSNTLTKRETLSPGMMMKMHFEEKPKIGIPRASATNSIVFQSSHLKRTNVEFTTNLEGNEALSGNGSWSRINNSILFSNYRKPIESFSSKSLDLNLGSTKRQSSVPPKSSQNSLQRSRSQDDIATATAAADKLSTFNFLANSSKGSLDTNGALNLSERLLPGYSLLLDNGKNFCAHRNSLPSEIKPGKLTAFPDGWNYKPKVQGKINPRPGKIIIYDKPEFSGCKREISCDVSDCLSWAFPAAISIKVIRGCWVICEKPDYKGKKIFLAEEDVELVDPWAEELEEETEDHDSKSPPTKRIIIGSLRRAIRDYTIPQISLFPEADGEGKRLKFYGESEDVRMFGYPPKITSIVVNSGLWLVYSEPFFKGQQCTLEVGGYRTLQEWGAKKPQVGSLMPLQMNGPRVEKPYEPKLDIFERPYYLGRSRVVREDSADFLSCYPSTGSPLSNAGSIKVLGGIWVGYSKERFRGHQYLLEEGEYVDWRSWGGVDEDLKSLRVIRADFSNPTIVLHPENNCEGVSSITVTASVPDLEQADSGDIIQSIEVLSGVWVAYEGTNYSGAQYIVEKGVYPNPQDWGAQSCKISSLHPILLVEPSGQQFRLKIQIFSEYDFNGLCYVIEEKKMGIPKDFKLQSCRVLSGSWALYEGQDYNGRVFVVSEGEYPDLQSMGCRMTTHIRCVKAIPHVFSQPLITLHGLENFEGKEIALDTEVMNLISDGYNNQILSLQVVGGVWVIYEYSNFRGRQILLEPIEIPNWPKYSSFIRIGSLMPITQKVAFFKIKNKEMDGLLSVLRSQEDVKSGRVIVAPENKELEQLWYYEEGLLKPKFAPDMSLQTIGTLGDTGSRVVLWSEIRVPKHFWTFEFSGTIRSLLYEGFVLDIKGGKSYDKDSAMICKCEEQNPVQQWEIQML
ncbi:beta/gamma crystallin domain-containing protein 2-like [Narcine bancroftii]|uniref:beta/gamma crystallin domain-containing protein 2-like n=1 Tax=Narcine bancroftii TaxID=1343680 RepID=UPI0038320359